MRLQGQKFLRLAILCIKCYTILIQNGYRILSVEAADIHKARKEKGLHSARHIGEKGKEKDFLRRPAREKFKDTILEENAAAAETSENAIGGNGGTQ